MSKGVEQYITDNIDGNNFQTNKLKKYIKNTCKLSRDVIQKLFKSIHELPVTEVVCEPNKLKLIEPLASLNYTSPYIVRKYKEKCKIDFNTEYIQNYSYQTYNPPADLIGMYKQNVYSASDFKTKLLPHEYIAHEKAPYVDSYKTIETNINDTLLKNKLESYYYGLNKGSKLHSNNTNSYVLQLTGKKNGQFTILCLYLY